MTEDNNKIKDLRVKIKDLEETKRKIEEGILTAKAEYKKASMEYKNKSIEIYYDTVKKHVGRFILMIDYNSNSSKSIHLGKIISITPKVNMLPRITMKGVKILIGGGNYKIYSWLVGDFIIKKQSIDNVISCENGYYRFITEENYKDIVTGFTLNKDFDPLQILNKS